MQQWISLVYPHQWRKRTASCIPQPTNPSNMMQLVNSGTLYAVIMTPLKFTSAVLKTLAQGMLLLGLLLTKTQYSRLLCKCGSESVFPLTDHLPCLPGLNLCSLWQTICYAYRACICCSRLCCIRMPSWSSWSHCCARPTVECSV